MPEEKIEIENIDSPGRTERVNRAKYEAMRGALLAVLPDAAPGLKVPAASAALLPLLPNARFPAGDKAGWGWRRCSGPRGEADDQARPVQAGAVVPDWVSNLKAAVGVPLMQERSR